MTEGKKLTDEQRKLAEENHRLIYWYLRFMRLPEDEFYDVLAIGYLNGIVKYTERPELRKYALSKICKSAMFSEWGSYMRAQRTKKRSATVISLDEPCEDDDATLHCAVSTGYYDLSDDMVRRENMKNLFNLCADDCQRKMVRMRAQGYNYQEIGKKLKVKWPEVRNSINSLWEPFVSQCYA